MRREREANQNSSVRRVFNPTLALFKEEITRAAPLGDAWQHHLLFISRVLTCWKKCARSCSSPFPPSGDRG